MNRLKSSLNHLEKASKNKSHHSAPVESVSKLQQKLEVCQDENLALRVSMDAALEQKKKDFYMFTELIDKCRTELQSEKTI